MSAHLLLLLTAMTTVAAAGCTLHEMGTQTVEIAHGGMQRSALVYTPELANLNGDVPPLLLVLHASSSSPAGIRNVTGFEPLSASTWGYVIAYPAGIGGAWNAGFLAPPASTDNVDDVGFIRALVHYLASLGCADIARVFVTGFSNGAFMAHRLACEASDIVSAIAPVAGNMGDILTEYPNSRFFNCTPDNHVAVMHWHGRSDQVFLLNGTVFGAGVSTRSVEQMFADWALREGCDASQTTEFTRHARTCRSAKCVLPMRDNVTLCTVANMTHTWPIGFETYAYRFFDKYHRTSFSAASSFKKVTLNALILVLVLAFFFF